MWFRDAAVIFQREVLRYRRDRAYWVGQLVFPLVVVGFIGFGLNDVVRLPSETDYVGHLASGMLALLLGSGGVGAGVTLIQDRTSGFLRTLLVAPVARGSIVAGKIAARLLASALLVVVLIALLSTFTELRAPHPWAIAIAALSITTAFLALGIVLASYLHNLESFRLLAALVTVPLYFLSGIFYPLATLPGVLRGLSLANPLSYGVDLLRYGLLDVHEIPIVLSASALLTLSAVAVVGSVWVFERTARA